MYKKKQNVKESKKSLNFSKLTSQGRNVWKHQFMQRFVCKCLELSFVLMEVMYRMY